MNMRAAFNVLQFIGTLRIPILKIGNSCMYTFYIVANIQNYTGKEIKYQRKPHRQERRVDEEKPDFIDRYIEALT
jgi:hypothetical protein